LIKSATTARQLGRDITTTPYNVELRSHRIYGLVAGTENGQPTPTDDQQTPTRVLTSIRTNVDPRVLLVDHDLTATATATPAAEGEDRLDGMKIVELGGMAEVVPYLLANHSPFLRPARSHVEEPTETFRNVRSFRARVPISTDHLQGLLTSSFPFRTSR
jgi:hypothetical protein